jgi:small conductance mechanosensitive channel
LLSSVADEVSLILDGFQADSSVNFICRPWVKTDDYWTVYWEVTRNVKERFDAEGISIPFPQRDLHVYKHDLA